MNRLVLVGAGHSHLIAIEELQKLGPQDTQITLVSDVSEAPYSGMLSGYMAGIYTEEDLTVDLKFFTEKFQIKLLIGKVVHIDPSEQSLRLSTGETILFDCLSINIGILPTRISCSEEELDKVVYLKPLSRFVPKWKKILDTKEGTVISVVGGGSAGFEVAHALVLRGFKEINLVTNSTDLLPELDAPTRKKARQSLLKKGVRLHFNSTAVGFKSSELLLSDNAPIRSDYVFICSGAKAQIIEGLPTDPEGYLLTNSKLQVEGSQNVFAAGDCINFAHQKLPKAGVYAVREGSVLSRNLFNQLGKKPLIDFSPQRTFLKIHLTGDKKALAAKGNFSFQGKLAWQLKDYLDRGFMKRFKEP